MHENPGSLPFNYDRFTGSTGQREALFGLPESVQFCTRCVISNQRPNSAVEFKNTKNAKKTTIHFDDEGVCDACRMAERKNVEIDWEERDHKLRALCDKFRSQNGSYDCLVPGSGGKDSFYAAHKLRYEYGMHPLTVTWAPHLYTDWGWKNFQAWIHAGFDNVMHTPNGRVHKLLTRLAVENLFHPFQPFMLGQKNIAPRMAVTHKIPLVFYGENEAEYGNPLESNESAQRSWDYFADDNEENMFLGGQSLRSLKQDYGLEVCDLDPYLPTNPDSMRQAGVEVHYLGYYLKWHPQSCYYYSVEHGGFQAAPERTPGTYSKYNSIDDKIDDFHFYTTFIKFGIGRATYDAAQEIRSGDITREDGVALVRRFDGEWPERFADECLDFMSVPPEHYPEASKQFEQPIMDRAYFASLVDRFRSPHLWEWKNGEWSLRHTVFNQGISSAE